MSEQNGTGGTPSMPLTTTSVASNFVKFNAEGNLSQTLTLGEGRVAPILFGRVPTTDVGFAAAAGFTKDGNVRAISALMPSTDITSPPTSGSATMNGAFIVIDVKDIEVTGSGAATISPRATAGPFELTVDFVTATLSGSGTSERGNLSVAGSFSGTETTGTATFDGVTGQMIGKIGAQRAAGAVHGKSSDERRVFSGGFAVDKSTGGS